MEEAVPSSTTIENFISSVEPDVLIVSPLTNAASHQVDYVKSAKALGIPTAVCIPSWDNLTNKGHLKILPDQVVVWNRAQLREAIELHGVPASRVTVTGAQPFDRWFGRAPSVPRDEFCQKVGLPLDRPFVLFCGSRSNIGEGVEPAFVRRWIETLRGDSAELGGDIGILVRPHPERSDWHHESLAEYPNTVVWPRRIANSIAPSARTNYFDSLYHSAAVVGANTSAMIEAAIVGRPVLTVRAPEFKESHEGTLHFGYLRRDQGGFVREAATLEEHRRQLADAIANPKVAQDVNRRFVQEFIRPHGLGRPCTPILVEVIERLKAHGTVAQLGFGKNAGRVMLRLLVRGVTAYDAALHPRMVRRVAKRSSRFLRRLAAPVGKRHRRLSATTHFLADRLEVWGVRASDRLKRRRRRKKAERIGEHRQIIQHGARLLDPHEIEGVDLTGDQMAPDRSPRVHEVESGPCG
jgi:hypothetical protein